MEYVTINNIGDEVWFMYNNKALSGTIKDIMINSFKSICGEYEVKTKESYNIHISSLDEIISYSSDIVFKSKEELIKSL